MSAASPRLWGAALPATAMAVAVAGALLGVRGGPAPLVLLSGALAAVLLPPPVALRLALVGALLLPLVRRLVAPGGYIENDPLALLVSGLVLLAVARVQLARGNRRSVRKGTAQPVLLPLLVLVGLSTCYAVVADVPPLIIGYGLLVLVPTLLLAMGVASGIDELDLWPFAARLLRWAVPVTAIYGIAQFLLLPPWDASWMISSGLQSIGAPVPGRVRVFATYEISGVAATFFSVSLLVLATASDMRPRVRGLLLPPVLVALTLTAVRGALLAAVLVGVLTALVGSRSASTRAAGVALVAMVGLGVTLVVRQFGALNVLLSSDRLLLRGDTADVSLVERLQLLTADNLAAAGLLGTGPGTTRFAGVADRASRLTVDNGYLDVALQFGLAAGVLFLLFAAITSRLALILLRTGLADDRAAAACVLFTFLVFLAGNPLYSGFSVFFALAAGHCFRATAAGVPHVGPSVPPLSAVTRAGPPVTARTPRC